jgi:hypothetical protein
LICLWLQHFCYSSSVNNIINITIDKRYETSLIKDSIESLEQILSEKFKQKTLIEYHFGTKIENSLAQKKSQEKQEKQRNAEYSISNDTNLIQILEQFSGKITSGSIKPTM